ncbi:MAG: UDP-N-acetylmuramoyl-L-alanyl-D-glutamate--2,6-diaminopimelate ligase [Puniceicoccales bacterium]|jgi:UDP-N-acetylmuramoyl-L-alanyl-D-glutamate--2,6-diaminopimelate ligase|nr:UDP-N-acetylmuramoyl-L-alanyl-D-glutamate--2,6-diaminopimelate ligase [Puniceicoccales bacterium]
MTAIIQHSLQSLSHGKDGQWLHFQDRVITGLSCDSRMVKSGDLFFAILGSKQNGESFIPDAMAKGCAAIVTERECPLDPKTFPQWVVPDVRRTLAETVRYFYRFPDEALDIYAVTGTNGKTTIAYLLQYLLSAERRAGYLGTLFYDTGHEKYPAPTTTPDPIHLQQLLRQMVDQGVGSATLELSSHALDQKRAFGMKIGTAIFTNLAEDHLEYHGGREAYFDAKSRLFDGRNGSVPPYAILNGDDPYGRRLQKHLSGLPAKIYTYGCSENVHVRAHSIEQRHYGTFFNLTMQGMTWSVESPLWGIYNVRNVLASMAALLATGRFSEKILERLRNFPGIPGRTQVVTQCGGLLTMVDYAHTADALAKVLEMLKPLCSGRLLLVFGCGGDRDRAKRPEMMRIAQQWADEVWATGDNPRTESQEQIFSDMRAGLRAASPAVHWIHDRREAIFQAVHTAQVHDIILVAGKGHETYQEIGTERFPFDDAEILEGVVKARQ